MFTAFNPHDVDPDTSVSVDELIRSAQRRVHEAQSLAESNSARLMLAHYLRVKRTTH